MKFYSRIINRELERILKAETAVTNVVGSRIHRGVGYPSGVTLPALLFRGEHATYDGPVQDAAIAAQHIHGGTYRYTVQIDDQGESDTTIAPAAEAQLQALAGTVIDTPEGHQITFQALGEIPVTTDYQGNTVFQRLGSIYLVTVTE